MPRLLCCPRGSFAKIFFMKLLKLPYLRKFSDAEISGNSSILVVSFVAKINFAKMPPCHTFLLSMWLFAKIFFQLIWKSLAIITGHDNDQ